MGDHDEAAKKAAKKMAKAEAKRLKKQHKTPSSSAHPATPDPVDADKGSTPAERSASAAERQVRLQQRRVIISALGVLIALAMLLWTIKPWARRPQPVNERVETPSTQPHN